MNGNTWMDRAGRRWMGAGLAALLASGGLAWAATPALVTVGDAGNASDTTGFGAVGYAYRIGVNEVTRSEYATFLNAVAATDPHGLYNPNMGIVRTGSPGSYAYAATDGARSVAWVSWYDALRYANWLSNGQLGGARGAASTEFGAYAFSGETAAGPRNPAALFFLPSENEWYKAAYYQGGTDAFYWAYPTRSDTPPLASAPTGSDNAANYDQAVNGVTPAGSYPATQGYYGTHDQAGNLWEWNEAQIDGDRGLRGGSFGDYPLLLNYTYRDSQPPADENEFVGFRVAAAASSAPPGGNQAPVALADSYDAKEGTPLAVAAPGVLANDADADGNALTARLAAGPVHGSLSLNEDGSFTYTPASGYAGTDSFSYKPNDGFVDGSAVAVTITVQAGVYTLTVINGSGGGDYAFGTVVPLQANAAPAGMVFDRWTGATNAIARVTSASTTLTMPRSPVSVTATYRRSVMALDITLAEWDSSKHILTVAGTGPAGKTVTVSTSSGLRIGLSMIKADGSWRLRQWRLFKTVPSSVRATCNGVTDEMPLTLK